MLYSTHFVLIGTSRTNVSPASYTTPCWGMGVHLCCPDPSLLDCSNAVSECMFGDLLCQQISLWRIKINFSHPNLRQVLLWERKKKKKDRGLSQIPSFSMLMLLLMTHLPSFPSFFFFSFFFQNKYKKHGKNILMSTKFSL